MAVRETEIVTAHIGGLAAEGSQTVYFYVPDGAHIKRYFAIASEAQAAHATQTLEVTFTDLEDDGEGTDVLATLTNDSGEEDSLTQVSSAWAAGVVKELVANDRPDEPENADNQFDRIERGHVISAGVAKAAGTETGDVTVGIEYQRGVARPA